MRKAIGLNVAVLVIVMVLTSGTAFAGNGIPISGPHWNINFVGHPKDYKGSGDDSSGHSIMIPLKNVPEGVQLTCKDIDGVVVIDDKGESTTVAPTGARIYFLPTDHFAIIDRDATDENGATIEVPVSGGDNAAAFDVYIRVLGKPATCMNINAYAYDKEVLTWYLAGTVYVSRQKGKTTFVRANELFTVCVLWDPVSQKCLDFTSVFDGVYDNYFWSILNDGTRLVQVRLYPTN